MLVGTGVDIVFSVCRNPVTQLSSTTSKEELMPVATSAFVECHRAILDKSPPDWSGPAHRPVKKQRFVGHMENWFDWKGLLPSFEWFLVEYLASGRLIERDCGWTLNNASLYYLLTDRAPAKLIARKFNARISAIMWDT